MYVYTYAHAQVFATVGMDGCTEEMDVLGKHLYWR